jgi:ADP-heptose:LPS heptosyltransferase
MFDALANARARLVSLQRGPQAALPCTLASRLANPNDHSMQVSETISLIRTLDLVVTVDSFMAHLAGAMGKPTCVLLKKHADWRWMSGSACAWYPRAALFRQHREGQWADALDALARALRDIRFWRKSQKPPESA